MSRLSMIEKLIDDAVDAANRAKRLIDAIPVTANEIEEKLAETLVTLDGEISALKAALEFISEESMADFKAARTVFDKVAAAQLAEDYALVAEYRGTLYRVFDNGAAQKSPEGTP